MKTEQPISDTLDYRQRSAARRREVMRSRLIEGAILVFAEKGVDASVVDDVIRVAKVSRGTFYKYFQSNQELLVAAGEALGNEILQLVEDNVRDVADPVERITKGLFSFMYIAQRYPLVARFAYHVGFAAIGPSSLIYKYLPAHIEHAISIGAFHDAPRQAILDLIVGPVLACVARISLQPSDVDYGAQVVTLILSGLGVSHERALFYTKMSPHEIDRVPDSILERTDSVARADHAQSGDRQIGAEVN